MTIRYACWLDFPCDPDHVRYQYVVQDKERDQKFAVGFMLPRAEIEQALFDVRARWARDCEVKLWIAVKRESPGTYLDAVAAGWVPADVVARDR